MEPTEHARCRVCRRPLDANGRGDYVDCCSRFVPRPRARQEGRSVVRWWGDLADRTLLGVGGWLEHVTPGGRFMLFVLAVGIVTLIVWSTSRWL